MSTTTSVPAQDFRAEHTLPDHLNLPPAFDAKRWPILERHWFGIVPLFVPVTLERAVADVGADVEAEAA